MKATDRRLINQRSTARTSFHEVTAAIVASLDVDQTLDAVARAATGLVNADIAAIFLVDGEGTALVPRGVHGGRSKEWRQLRLDVKGGLNATSFRTGEIQRVDDYLSVPRTERPASTEGVVADEPIRSAIIVPVRRRGTRIGTIGVYRRRVRPFESEEEFLLTLLADQAGIALDNALTHAELRATRDRLQTAIEVAASLSASLDPNDVVRTVLERAVDAGHADRAVLLRLEGDETVVEDYYDLSGAADLLGYRHPVDRQPIMREAIRRRSPVLGGRYDLRQVEAPLDRSLADVKHTATIPLILDDQVTFVLVLSRRTDQPFLSADVSMFQLIGNQAVLALRNAHLFEQAKEVTRAQSDFLNMAAHELRTPLSVIAGYVSMMQDGTLGSAPAAWRAPLATLGGKSAELETLISELLVASRLEAGTIPFRGVSVNLAELVQQAAERLGPRARLLGARVSLRFPKEPMTAIADPEQVGRILDNLLNNALSYGGERPEITVTVRDGESRQIAVRDRGHGVPAALRTKIFERFYRVDDPTVRHVPGTGLGLYISSQLASRMGGTLRLEKSSPGRGSTFVLTLPAG